MRPIKIHIKSFILGIVMVLTTLSFLGLKSPQYTIYDVDDVMSRLSDFESSLSSIKSNVRSIKSDVSNIESDVSSIEYDVSSIASGVYCYGGTVTCE